MSPEEFRSHGHAVVDWISDYLEGVDDYPVLAQVQPRDVRRSLEEVGWGEGEPFSRLMDDFDRIIVPGITHWNHPAFFGYFSITGSGPGILGEMLSAALNVNAMVWKSSPSGTELEEHTLDWLRHLVGLPEAFAGVINDTASSSSLYALAAAREQAYPEARMTGLSAAPPGRVYASEEAHSSIDKAVITLGLGREGIRKIPVDEQFRMVPHTLRVALDEDRARGLRPVAVVATLGTTSTTSVDPVAEIAALAKEFGLWLHVDAAYAGPAAMLPEMRPMFRGWERADSVVLNPHKWLFTPVDCSALYCRRPEALRQAFSLTPEYLKTLPPLQSVDPGAGIAPETAGKNLMDYGVALGRRFRSLKLWFVLRYFGVEGIRRRLREHLELARAFAELVAAADDWELVAPVPFSTVVFRFSPSGIGGREQDDLNLRILHEVNASGRAFLSHTRCRGRIALRLAVGNLRTREEHLSRAWQLLRQAGEACGT